ncbi:5-hydroxytryptamine receptor 4 [Portunus trituberculatus]|uniref:5-hydroxytryptamine receptor 4 n=1 Tax=Portunus trituberculatus TaxID=210409 RepID=A0A5B7FUR8_PORTR|nr:5-hydroxytryptamine receptor 4 [Portunus trituberculatus]
MHDYSVYLCSTFVLYYNCVFQEGWLSGAGCWVAGGAWATLHVAAVWTITALNLDKYVAIAAPLHYARFVSPARVAAAVGVSWVLAASLCALPMALPGMRGAPQPPTGCSLDLASAPPLLGRSYAFTLALLGYLLPALLVATANFRILVIARHHRHRIVTALWDVTVSAQATVTPQRSHFYLSRYRGRSAATTVCHLVGTFLLLYLPPAACVLYEAVARVRPPHTLVLANLVLLTLAPAINGFVYGIKSKVLRKNFKNFLRKRLYRSEVNYEIQSRAPSVSASRRPSMTPSLSMPLQHKLQRRMSEILVQPSVAAAGDAATGAPRLVRRSSELSMRARGGSSCSITRETPPPRLPSSSPLGVQGDSTSAAKEAPTPSPKIASPPKSPKSPKSPLIRPSRVFRFLQQSNSLEENAGVEVEGGGPALAATHRSSLRRALFARNKQKSLDFEMTSLTPHDTAAEVPPRSASTQVVGEPASPSLARPLLLDGQAPPPPLSPARKTKRVSWSSDSFSDSPMESDSDAMTPTGAGVAGAGTASSMGPRYRTKALLRHNGLRFHFSKVSLERIDSEDTRAPPAEMNGPGPSPPPTLTMVHQATLHGAPVTNGRIVSSLNGRPKLLTAGFRD